MRTPALHQAGYHVLTAPESPDGITPRANHPDLVFLNVVMPSTYGLEVWKALRPTRHSRPSPSSS